MLYAMFKCPETGTSFVHTESIYVCLNLTFFCFSLLPLKHLLLWRQSLLQELHVKLILLLHLFLLPEAHLIAYVALEAKAQCDHWVANAREMDTRSTLISSLVKKLTKQGNDALKIALNMLQVFIIVW